MYTVRNQCKLLLSLLSLQLVSNSSASEGNHSLPRLVVSQQLQRKRVSCYMRYQQPTMPNKSIDFENPSVFELLASNYSRDRSPFFELLHQWRDCIALSYWINNEPNSTAFKGYLKFTCGIQELLQINLMHWRASYDSEDFCLSMLYGDRPLEQYGCPMLAMSQTVPIVLQAHVGSMVLLTQQTPSSFEYLLFQRVTRYDDMLSTLNYFEKEYKISKKVLQPRAYFTSEHWLRCDCDAILDGLGKLYQCLGISRKRTMQAGYGARSVSDDIVVMAAIGIGGGVTFFLLLKIRLIC